MIILQTKYSILRRRKTYKKAETGDIGERGGNGDA